MRSVRGSPTVTGPEVRVPDIPKPRLISIWHCGGFIVKTTGLPVLTLKLINSKSLVIHLNSKQIIFNLFSTF